jgi:hypothetical protein
MSDYASALKQARSDLAEANEQKQALEVRIVRLKQAIDALAVLAGEAPQGSYLPDFSRLAEIAPPPVDASLFGQGYVEELGMTDACRDALIAGARHMTPVEVKEQMETMNYAFKGANPLASIHTVLKRLAANGRARADQVEGKTAYKWVGETNRNALGIRGARKRLGGLGEEKK